MSGASAGKTYSRESLYIWRPESSEGSSGWTSRIAHHMSFSWCWLSVGNSAGAVDQCTTCVFSGMTVLGYLILVYGGWLSPEWTSQGRSFIFYICFFWGGEIQILFIWLLWVLVVACEIFSCSIQTLGWSKWVLVPWLGIKPGPPALGAQSLSHWTDSEVPRQTSEELVSLPLQSVGQSSHKGRNTGPAFY